MGIKSLLCVSWRWFNKVFIFLIPFVDLFIRFWISKQFFNAGLTKIANWDTTVFLFTHEYNVPLLSPNLAAMLGTATELAMPVLLLLGLFGRVPAVVLFVFNIVAVISYPFLLTEAGAVGLNDHFYWGVLLMVMMTYGPNKLSLDYLIGRFWKPCR